jgi:hypothetical protein
MMMGKVLAGHTRLPIETIDVYKPDWVCIGWPKCHLSWPRTMRSFVSGKRAISLLIGNHLFYLAWWPRRVT